MKKKRFVKSLTRFSCGLLLLPFCAGAGAAFYSLLGALSRWPTDRFPFLVGFASYGLIHFLLFKPLRTYVFGHELTHALAAVLIGGKVKKFKVSKHGGSVHLTKTNLFVALAPYCIPLYTLFVLVGFTAVGWFWPVDRYMGAFVYAMGFTLAFHLFLTADAMMQGQPDITQSGVFLSLLVIFLSNIGSIVFVLSLLLPEVSMVRFAQSSWKNTARLCRWANTQSQQYWKQGRS